MRKAMRKAKRVDKVAPNMRLNEALVNHYHEVREDYREIR